MRPEPNETHPVDLELVLRMQQGDLDALGGLYDRHRHLVYRTALAITGDQEAAADLLQEVFLRLYRFGHRIDPHRPLEPWLYRMTANMAYTWANQRRRWYRLLQEMGDAGIQPSLPEGSRSVHSPPCSMRLLPGPGFS